MSKIETLESQIIEKHPKSAKIHIHKNHSKQHFFVTEQYI